MALSLRDKQNRFRKDPEQRERFEEVVRQTRLEDLLWPDRQPRQFPAEFRAKQRGREVVFPLIHVDERLDYVGVQLEHMSRTMSGHPAVAYLYLTLFQKQELAGAAEWSGSPRSRSSRRAAKPSAASEKKKVLYNKVQRLKRRLVVSDPVRKARDWRALSAAVLEEMQRLTIDFYEQREKVEALEIELEMHRKTLGDHKADRNRNDELVAENTNLKISLAKEQERTRSLESELSRLTEQVLAGGPVTSDSEMAAEYAALRHDHQILSQKYDALVSKNIDLSNRLERFARTRGLEESLNAIRDKINSVLKSGLLKDDEALLSTLKNEITQIQRARGYLGRALYDVGMLYLRTGDRRLALVELRAARELGVEDPETNRLIATLS